MSTESIARYRQQSLRVACRQTPQLTLELCRAAAQDAGNRHMRTHGRTVWDASDYNAAVEEFDRLISYL